MRSQPRAHFFESLGITLSDAINLFLHQSLREGGLPFEVKRADAKKTQEQKYINNKQQYFCSVEIDMDRFADCLKCGGCNP